MCVSNVFLLWDRTLTNTKLCYVVSTPAEVEFLFRILCYSYHILNMRAEIFPKKLIKKKRITAYALIINGDKFLLVQEAVGKIRGLWGLPGGGVKKGELPRQAAEREAEEEVGYNIEIIGKVG